MKKINVKQNSKEWLEARRGKVMGSSLKDFVPSAGFTKENIIDFLEESEIDYPEKAKKDELEMLLTPEQKGLILCDISEKKKGFYILLAEMMGIFDEDDEYCGESPMNRGHIMEPQAAAAFEKKTGKKCEEQGIWVSNKSEHIGISPDRVVSGTNDTEAVEIKCLSAWKHLKAIDIDKIPDEYYYQMLQYFIVNDDLKILHFCLYNPLVVFKPLHVIKFQRKDYLDEIELYKGYQINQIKQVEAMRDRLLLS